MENKIEAFNEAQRFVAFTKAKTELEKRIKEYRDKQIEFISNEMSQGKTFEEAKESLPANLNNIPDYNIVEYKLFNTKLLENDEELKHLVEYSEKLKSTSKLPEEIKELLSYEGTSILARHTNDVKSDPFILKIMEDVLNVPQEQYLDLLVQLETYISEELKIIKSNLATLSENPDKEKTYKMYLNIKQAKYVKDSLHNIFEIPEEILNKYSKDDLIEKIVDVYNTKLNVEQAGIDVNQFIENSFRKETVSRTANIGFDALKYANELTQIGVNYIKYPDDRKSLLESREALYKYRDSFKSNSDIPGLI